MEINVTINDELFRMELEHDPYREGFYIARLFADENDTEGQVYQLEGVEPKAGSLTLSIDGQVGFYEFISEKGKIKEVMFNNRSYKASIGNPQQDKLEELLNEWGAGMGGTASETVLKAPMPGKILGVSVKEGDNLELGQVALVLEAMKMENEISSTIEGKVTKVHVKIGDLVNVDQPLIEVELNS